MSRLTVGRDNARVRVEDIMGRAGSCDMVHVELRALKDNLALVVEKRNDDIRHSRPSCS
jgi:hypothetical protein